MTRKGRKLWFFFGILPSLCIAAGPQWSAPEPVPTLSTNTIFTGYNPTIGKMVVTWIDAISFPFPNQKGFFSTFDGTQWSAPGMLPINGAVNSINVVPNTYDGARQQTMITWSDASAVPYSSFFNGLTWSPPQAIPDGGAGALIPFASYNPGSQQLMAVWCDFTSAGHYSLFDGTNWSAEQSTPAANAFLQFPTHLSEQFIVVWADGGSPIGIGYSSVFNGSSWSTPQVIASNVSVPNVAPMLGGSQAGQLFVMWADQTTGQAFSSTTSDGITWSSPQPVPGSHVAGSSAAIPVYDPTIDQVVAVWIDSTLGSVAYSLYDGTSWATAQAIPGGSSPSTSAVATFDPSLGKLMATWGNAANQGQYALFYIPSITFSGGGNLKRVADYINAVGQTAQMQPILAKLNRLSEDQLTDALSSISNAKNAFLPWVAAETSFLFGHMLQERFSERRWESFQDFPFYPQKAISASQVSLLAAMGDQPLGRTESLAHKEQSYAFWLEGFGSLAYQKAQEQNPAYHAATGGAMLGFDYYGDNVRIANSFAYGRSTIDMSQNAAKDTIDAFALSFYGMGSIGNTYIEGGCLGVYTLNASDRHIVFPGFNAHAKANFSGWQAVPHLGVGYDINLQPLILEPFANIDCAILFQDGFSEHGAAPLNVRQPHSTSALSQAQAGLRGYVSRSREWGAWLFRFTAAYQYKKGWDIGKIQDAFFVGLPPGFTVTSLAQAQNAFIPGLECFLRFNKGVFTSISYEGEFASQYMANSLLLKVGAFW